MTRDGATKVLVHIHTLNDSDVIRTCLDAVMAQTRPVDKIIIVDNGSTDGTLGIDFPENTTIIRNGENLGTSGAVAVGLRYGLTNGFDWIWTLDADSAPRPDALRILLDFYASFPTAQQRNIAALASLPVNAFDGKPRHALKIGVGEIVALQPDPKATFYEYDCGVWSGTLFRADAVREVGLPSADYVLDLGEVEYGYRCRQAGYRLYIHQGSIIDHDVGGAPSSAFVPRSLGPLKVTGLELPPIRAYYIVRNNLYFWFYEYKGGRKLYVRALRLYKAAKLIANAFLMPERKLRMLGACLRGYWDGVVGNMSNRYQPKTVQTGMSGWRTLWRLFTPAERVPLLILMGVMCVGAALEATGVALIVPFIGLLASPETVIGSELARPVLEMLHIDSERKLLITAGLGLLLFYFLKSLYLTAMYFWLYRFVFKKRVTLSDALLTQYLEGPLAFHLRKNSSELIKITTDSMQRFAMGVMLPLIIFVSEGMVVVALVSLLLYMAPLATIAVGAMIGIPAAVFYKLARRSLAMLGQASEESLALVFQWVKQGLGSIKETKLLGAQDYFVQCHSKQVSIFARAYSSMTFLSQAPRMLMEFFAIVGLVLIAFILLQRDNLASALPLVSMFALAAARLMPSANRLMMTIANLRFHFSSAELVLKELEELRAMARAEETSTGTDAAGLTFERELSLDDLSYRHSGSSSKWFLDSVSLKIPKGSFVGIIGPTGAGKTTMMDIILGLLPPTSGAIRVDDQDIRNNLVSWQRRVGYVPQNGYLVDDTIRRNVALAIPDDKIVDERIWEVLRIAQLDEVVRALPEGLDARTGEDGSHLSGGERQRLCIARAIYRDPEVLVMDEASSSLDPNTEQAVARTIEALRGKKTIVVISHRMSMVKNCDCIYMLRQGRIVTSGTYDTLLRDSAEFQKLSAVQELSTM